MATIALYANQINQMPSLIANLRSSVSDYTTELSSLNTKVLTIDSSVCNLDAVVSSLQSSTQTQEDMIASLDSFQQATELFIAEVERVDNGVADLINDRKSEFYDSFPYLKPNSEKNWWEKGWDCLVSLGEWCKENWKLIVVIILVIAAIVVLILTAGMAGPLIFILVGACKGLIMGALIGGLIGGIVSVASGGDFLEGFRDGVFAGALTGALFGGAFAGLALLGAAGRLVGMGLQLYLKGEGVREGLGALARGDLLGAGLAFSCLLGNRGPRGQGALSNSFAGNPSRLGQPTRNCSHAGEPVDVVTGAMFFEQTDFAFPGPIPFEWKWSWASNATEAGSMGHGIQLQYDTCLSIDEEEDALFVILPDGRAAYFPTLADGEADFNAKEKIRLSRLGEKYILFESSTNYSYHYTSKHRDPFECHLTQISNETSFSLDFFYDDCDQLVAINDSAGRDFAIERTESGLIQDIYLEGKTRKHLVRYEYNDHQDLISLTDALSQTEHMTYQDHRMTKRTFKDGKSFYWQYEDIEEGQTRLPRVLHTWGDGGVLDVTFEYLESCTKTTNSLGAQTEYHFDKDSLIKRTIHPGGGIEYNRYNDDFNLTAHTDVLGSTTSCAYAPCGMPSLITYANGTSQTFAYNEFGKLTEATDPAGVTETFAYDKNLRLIKTSSQDGATNTYRYSDTSQLESLENPLGERISLAYDIQGNLISITAPDGTTGHWAYDDEGSCTTATNPLGAKDTFTYDALRRVIQTNTSDGNQIHYTYDPTDMVLSVKDKHLEINNTYTIMGSLASSEQKAKGHMPKTTTYHYNTEEELLSVINEAGEIYTLERDCEGNIAKETFFNGMTRSYKRDIAGRVTEILRPEDRWTKIGYNALGLIEKTSYSDDTHTSYDYDRLGRLTQLKNNHTQVCYVYDQKGNLIKETQGGHEVKSHYDIVGKRLRLESSLGADIAQSFDQGGRLTKVIAKTASGLSDQIWEMTLGYNALGQETERVLPGELISKRRYDISGRPLEESARVGKRKVRQKTYTWDISSQLKAINCQLTGQQAHFGYDPFGSLTSVLYQGPSVPQSTLRKPDQANNYYETEERNDRTYGKNGELLEKLDIQKGKPDSKTSYSYDGEGNLISKTRNGKVWEYSYTGSGMLSSVTLPDRNEVTFEYDPLGRRTKKKSAERTVHFVWDGDTLLHEWQEDRQEQKLSLSQSEPQGQREPENPQETLITWVYQDGSFTPSAKLTARGSYSILSDYLGTPEEAYDDKGQLAWSAKLNIYGKVDNFTGKEDFIPFRYQGQYADAETDLYYNRYRYYDPEMGQYTQLDPIGLEGGNPTLYGYVSNPLTEIDPFGLKQCSRNETNSPTNSNPNRAQQQLATNRTNGRRGEDHVFNRLNNNPNVDVLGRQVYIRTPAGERHVDILIRNRVHRQFATS